MSTASHPGETPPNPEEFDSQEQEANSNDPEVAPFLAKFRDLPSVRQAQQRLLLAGYAEDDPMFLLIEVLSLYDRRQEVLTSRQIQMVGRMVQALEEGTKEIAAIRAQLEELMAAIEDNQDSATTLGKQFAEVLRSNADFAPFLERAGREVRNAADLIENRSTKAIILSYLAPALTLIAGLIIGMMVRN